MAVSTGDSITESDFNTLRSRVNTILGTPSGTTESNARGYGVTLTSSSVSANSLVTEADWDALRVDIDKAHVHQNGSSAGLTNVTTSDLIAATIFNDLETAVVGLEATPFQIDSGQGSTEAVITSQRTTAWNGTRQHEFTMTWANANTRKAFFNAGGYVIFSASIAYSGSEAKTLDWQTMLADMGSVGFRYNEAFNIAGTGNAVARGTPGTIGNYDLTASNQELFTKGGVTPYSENAYKIFAKTSAAESITFLVEFQDNDVGDDTTPGDPYPNAVDEDVQGTLTSTIQMFRPTGDVAVAAPSSSNSITL